MTGVLHALCNAHHLRELKALVEIEKEDWAHKMQRLLRRACHATNLAREQGVPLKPGLIALFDRGYDAILAEGMAFHEAQPRLRKKARRRGRPPRRVGHNLLLRLSTRKQDVLRFLTDPQRALHQQPGARYDDRGARSLSLRRRGPTTQSLVSSTGLTPNCSWHNYASAWRNSLWSCTPRRPA